MPLDDQTTCHCFLSADVRQPGLEQSGGHIRQTCTALETHTVDN